MIYFRSLRWISKSTSKIISIRSLVTEKRSFKTLKILSYLARFISKTKKDQDLSFPSVNYFGKHLSYLKICHTLVNYCWNYGSSNLLFWSTWHSWQRFNNRQSETAVNLLIPFFESSVWWKFQVFWPTDRKMTTL